MTYVQYYYSREYCNVNAIYWDNIGIYYKFLRIRYEYSHVYMLQ